MVDEPQDYILPDAIADRVDDLSEKGNSQLDDDGDWNGAILTWRQALELLPEPKTVWDAWVWLNASIGDAARRGGDLQTARQALLDAMKNFGGATNPFILLRLGQTLVDLQDTKNGIDHLLRAYMLEGAEVFEDDGSDYLALLRDQKLID